MAFADERQPSDAPTCTPDSGPEAAVLKGTGAVIKSGCFQDRASAAECPKLGAQLPDWINLTAPAPSLGDQKLTRGSVLIAADGDESGQRIGTKEQEVFQGNRQTSGHAKPLFGVYNRWNVAGVRVCRGSCCFLGNVASKFVCSRRNLGGPNVGSCCAAGDEGTTGQGQGRRSCASCHSRSLGEICRAGLETQARFSLKWNADRRGSSSKRLTRASCPGHLFTRQEDAVRRWCEASAEAKERNR